MKQIYLLLMVLATSTIAAQESYTLSIPSDRYHIDEEHRLIICNIKLDTIANLDNYSETELVLEESYLFSEHPSTISTKETYQVSKDGNNYALYFSKFPLIAMNAPEPIIDDPKRFATFVYTDSLEVQKSKVGVELRGGSSQGFPKKTYDLEFWEDEAGEDNKDMQFGDLREDDDWILDALYNEPLRMRAYTSHRLWLEMHELYYMEKEEEAKAGADVMYVELFLNDAYNGVYMLSEQVDKKQLQLKSFKNDEIRGELYKAEGRTNASGFRNTIEIDNSKDTWGGFELKLPDEDDIIDWSNLYDFVDFAANEPYEDFHANLESRLHLDNAVDYFIFLNLVGATDNTGKNFYLARYREEEPYFFVPWDLDGTFGVRWDGTYLNSSEFILSDGLFDRLFVNDPNRAVFDKLYERYQELRTGVLSEEALTGQLNANYNLLKENKIYEREAMVWSNYTYNDEASAITTDWLADRLNYLDDYFENLNLSSESIQPKTTLTVYPNPVSDKVTVVRPSAASSKYSVYAVGGTLVKNGTLSNTQETIDLQNLTSGIYFLRVDEITKKLIVK